MSKKNLSLLMDGFMGEANQSEPVQEQAVVQAAEQVEQPAVKDERNRNGLCGKFSFRTEERIL